MYPFGPLANTSFIRRISKNMTNYTPGSARAIEFQKAMVFIDGTNLFFRLETLKLKLLTIDGICRHFSRGRDIIRTYLYTSQPYYEKAVVAHGKDLFRNVRVRFGDAVPLRDGNYKEKGVDALLVADLVYHAASKNFDFAMLMSADTDFARALKRVEDFGCRTAVISIGSGTPELLKQACDEVIEINEETLITNKWAVR